MQCATESFCLVGSIIGHCLCQPNFNPNAKRVGASEVIIDSCHGLGNIQMFEILHLSRQWHRHG